MKPLTKPERAAIDALRWLVVRGGWERAYKVAERTGQTPEGAASVLASCVRKGLAERRAGRSHMWFRLTVTGWNLARPRAAQQRASIAEGAAMLEAQRAADAADDRRPRKPRPVPRGTTRVTSGGLPTLGKGHR